MRSILVLNSKGGCGKSTVAMNLAAHFAIQGQRVALADCDPQSSSSDWLDARPEDAALIRPATLKAGKLRVPRGMDVVVIDTPASVHGAKLANFVRVSQTMVIPIMPSAVDMRAAERFIDELFSLRKLINRRIKVATIANRVREDTMAAARLDYFLDKLKLPSGQNLPFITVLRNSQNYIRASEKGLSIFEFAPSKTVYDREQWTPLLRWLNSKHSLPN